MSFVTVGPEFVGQAAGQLENIGSALSAANAAATSTTRVVPAAGDEVSAAIASLFSSHAQEYQALSAQVATFHSRFVSLLNAGAGSYISTEIASTHAAAASGSIAQSVGLGGILGPLRQSGTAFVNAVQAAVSGLSASGTACSG
jgi:hypothetical protein